MHVVIQAVAIALTQAVHILSLVVIFVSNYDLDRNYELLYIFFQVPFDIMNIATIAHIYSWTDIQCTLEFFEFVRK